MVFIPGYAESVISKKGLFKSILRGMNVKDENIVVPVGDKSLTKKML